MHKSFNVSLTKADTVIKITKSLTQWVQSSLLVHTNVICSHVQTIHNVKTIEIKKHTFYCAGKKNNQEISKKKDSFVFLKKRFLQIENEWKHIKWKWKKYIFP